MPQKLELCKPGFYASRELFIWHFNSKKLMCRKHSEDARTIDFLFKKEVKSYFQY